VVSKLDLRHVEIIGKLYEAVNEFLTVHFLDDVLVVIVTECATQLVVVHVRLVLSQTPESSYFL
jgi:hypothetical protein